MQAPFRGFGDLPRFFQIAFFVFLLIPIWSTVTLGSPWIVLQNGRPLDWVAVVAYWGGPLALCIALLWRSHLVVFLFMAECAALLLHVTLSGTEPNGSAGLAVVRAALVAGVAVLGFAFLSRDVAMPFFSAKRRGFRGVSRLRANTSLRVAGGAGIDRAAEMEDCSLTGMAFSFGVDPASSTTPFARGDRVKLLVRFERATLEVEGTIEWCVRDELFYRAGMSTSNVGVMTEVIRGATLRSVPAYVAALAKLTTTSSLSRAAMAGWIGCFGGVAAVPACGSTGFSGSGASGAKAEADAKRKHAKVDAEDDEAKDDGGTGSGRTAKGAASGSGGPGGSGGSGGSGSSGKGKARGSTAGSGSTGSGSGDPSSGTSGAQGGDGDVSGDGDDDIVTSDDGSSSTLGSDAQDAGDASGMGSIVIEDAESSVFEECTVNLAYNPSDVQCNILVASNNVWNATDDWKPLIAAFSDPQAAFISPLANANSEGREYCQLLDGTEKLIYVTYVKLGAGDYRFEAIMDDVGQVRLWHRSDPSQEKYASAALQPGDRGTVANLTAGGYAVVVETRDTKKAATAMAFSLKNATGNVVKRSAADGSWCIFRVPAATDVKAFLPTAAGCRPCFGHE